MLENYLPILIFLVLGVAFGVVPIALSYVIAPKNSYSEKLSPWECGVEPVGEANAGKFTVQFYIIAVLFVIFDVETLFLFPWAVVLDEIGVFAFIEMFLFIVILLVGFFYAWAKGALEWVK